jgi:energy-coupling factor transport system ATP-binding protein
VLDEPLTDLDPLGKEGVLGVIRRLKDMGITVVVIEHDPAALLQADRLIALVDGSVAFDGEPGGLLADPGRCRELGVPVWAPAEVARGLGLPAGGLAVDEVAAAVRTAGLRAVPVPPPPGGAIDEPLIEARDLTSGYPGSPDVLFGVSLTIRAGECVALLGQNGSGKTTLAKHAVGLVRPRKGGIMVKGRPVGEYRLATLSRIAGYVFQNPDHQIFSETVLEEVAFGLRNLGLPGNEVGERVREALEVVDLAGREAEDPFSLTKGERQRLAVASLLAYRPEAIFLDEPTTGLDAAEAERMMAFIKGLNRNGLTVVLITHAMWAAAEYAERTVVMSSGRVVLDGPTREVFSREDVLTPLTLAPPPAAALANRLGFRAVSASEVLMAFKGGRA